MKISESLEQLALYNLQKRAAAGQVDVAAEKLKRFHTILDMFAEDDDRRQTETNLSALALLELPVQSSPYGRVLQALSVQMAQKQTSFSTPAETLSETEQINRSVTRAATKYHLPENLIKGVIRAESASNPRAVSAAGAQGLMQLMPGTARELGVTDVFDIDQNVDGGARYLRQMIDRFDGDVAKALAASNAGPGTVERFEGKVPYRETIAYVDRVLKYSRQFV